MSARFGSPRKERARKRIAYVYDVFIKAAYWRMGYATRAFSALEQEACSRGVSGVALHVFGHNSPAQCLDAKLGYRPTNISMFKTLGHESGQVPIERTSSDK